MNYQEQLRELQDTVAKVVDLWSPFLAEALEVRTTRALLCLNAFMLDYDRVVKLMKPIRSDYPVSFRPLQTIQKRESILIDALSEIKASVEGKSDQPILDIIEGCIKELAEVSKEV